MQIYKQQYMPTLPQIAKAYQIAKDYHLPHTINDVERIFRNFVFEIFSPENVASASRLCFMSKTFYVF